MTYFNKVTVAAGQRTDYEDRCDSQETSWEARAGGR